MAPLTKESVETSSPANQPAIARATTPAKPSSGRLRADAVSLEIAVKVHGSRVTEVARGVAPQTEPFEEQTNTMIVFPQGGVLKMSTLVSVGQMVVVTNLRSKQDAICRVQKVRLFSNMPGYVEVEFTHPQPGYWGVHFPSETSTVSNKPAAPAPIAPAPPEPAPVAEIPVPAVSWAPAPVPVVPAEKPLDSRTRVEEAKPAAPPSPVFTPPSRPESSFISIGSQEKVQAVASNTPSSSKTSHFDQGSEAGPRESARHSVILDSPSAQSVAPLSSHSMQELRGDEEVVRTSFPGGVPFGDLKREVGEASVEATPVAASRATFGTLSGGSSLGPAPVASEVDFGTRLGAGLAVSEKEGEKPRGNWLLIAACVFVSVGVVGGGTYYYAKNSANAQKSSPVRSLAVNPAASSYSASSQPVTNPPIAPQLASTNEITVAERTATGASTTKTDAGTTKPQTTTKQPSSRMTHNVVSATLNAHPISSQRVNGNDANSAPSLDAGGIPASAQAPIPGVTSTSNSLMPPKPEEALRVGGDVKPGRLISSVQPVYPATARSAHIEGDVVIRTNIDETGKVINTQVISGPLALRQAALTALRQWKYTPATLNGQPTSIQVEVTIRFRL